MLNLPKRFVLPMVMLALGLLAVACATAKPADPMAVAALTVIKKAIADCKERQELQDEFVADACALAEKTDDAEARAVCDLLRTKVYTVTNIGQKFFWLEPTSKERIIPLFMIRGRELDDIPALKAIADQEVDATGYFRENPPAPLLIMLKYDKSASKMRKGLQILHQGARALYFISLPYDPAPDAEIKKTQREVRAYELDHRILDKLGGDRYASLIRDRVADFDMPAAAMPMDKQKKIERKLDAELDEIFGHSDGQERQFLKYEIRLETAFRYMDLRADGKENTDNMKALWFANEVQRAKEKKE